MSITLATSKVLWARAHDQCAFPGCQQALTQESTDATTGEVRTTPVGEQAHIRSSKPDGPRHDPKYPASKVHTYENLILLCPTHHARVDANSGAEFTVEALIGMRKTHETQAKRRDEIDKTVQKYMAQQYGADDRVLFEQVDLNGPTVDSMFVDVPFSCRPDVSVAGLMQRIAREQPGDVDVADSADGQIVTGAAQTLLHPDWQGNALLVGGPGQGKSTLLQYVCQFHRARLLRKQEYTGQEQELNQLTESGRVSIRLDLRTYAQWASRSQRPGDKDKRKRKRKDGLKASHWPTIEEYIGTEIANKSGGRTFSVEDLGLLVSSRPVLLALDGLDEVANLSYREEVSRQIVDTQLRLAVDAADLVVLVATRPGGTTAALWSSDKFPRLNLRSLTHGPRLQYLQRWTKVANLSKEATDKLQRTFMENQHVPHIRELASYPMQLAILLHLLHRRQMLPQRRTDLYSEYLKTFLDREQREDKEPLLAEERQVIEDVHSYIGWYIQTQVEEGSSSGSIKRDELKQLLRSHLAGRDNGQRLADRLFSAVTTRVLCLIERDPGSGSFQFDVQSLREYFAAVYIFDEGKRDARDDSLVELLKRPYWSNVCRFLVGMYSKGEVRGMRSVLQYLAKDKYLGLHPLLRSTAALFLNDRTYEGQKDEPIQEIVDFVLGGAGIVLAEDGLLDVAGAGLHLSERAGRSQAVRHLRTRLENETEPEIRSAAAASLCRHAIPQDDLASWWWGRFEPTWRWLETASQLGILGRLNGDAEAKLAELLRTNDSDRTWGTELLTAGFFDGRSDDVLSTVKREINGGAGEVIKIFDRASPAGRLLTGAAMATLQLPSADDLSRTRWRGREESSVLSLVVDSLAALRNRPSATATETDWQKRLMQICDVWGDGWVLRQAVAAIPLGISLPTIAQSLEPKHGALWSALSTEAAARGRRGDADWWHQQLADASDDLTMRHWLFSVSTRAYSSVVIKLAAQINEAVDKLAPKHYTAIRQALDTFATASASRTLSLAEPLRLNQAVFSPRTLWLVLPVSTVASVEQIRKRLIGVFEVLPGMGLGDLRAMMRLVGNAKTIKFETFRGRRESLPIGGWASDVKIGVLRASLASEVLNAPHEWPADLVQRAVESVEARMLASLSPLRQAAETENWFED